MRGMQQHAEIDPERTFVCLRQDLLRPGDVLLVRNSGLEARGISLAHSSRFTHAALFVDRSRLFEADGFGVGMAAAANLSTPDGPVVILPDCKAAAVFRHPQLTRLEPGSTSEADLSLMLEAIVARKVQPYSRLSRLSKAAGPLEPLASVVLEAMDFHEALHQPRGSARRKHDEGRFCSEIVCEVMEELGYPVFGDGRAHADVGPGTLTEAGLVEVTRGLVVARRCGSLPGGAKQVAGVIDAYLAARAGVLMSVEQALAERLDGAGSEVPTGRADIARAIVDHYARLLEEVRLEAESSRRERHTLRVEGVRGALMAARGGDGLRAALAQAVRLIGEYEAMRLRAGAQALRRLRSGAGSDELRMRAVAIERWVRDRWGD